MLSRLFREQIRRRWYWLFVIALVGAGVLPFTRNRATFKPQEIGEHRSIEGCRVHEVDGLFISCVDSGGNAVGEVIIQVRDSEGVLVDAPDKCEDTWETDNEGIVVIPRRCLIGGQNLTFSPLDSSLNLARLVTVRIPPTEPTLRVVLPRAVQVHGVVVRRDGTAVAGATVYRRLSGGGLEVVRADARGRWVIGGLAPGIVELAASEVDDAENAVMFDTRVETGESPVTLVAR